MGCCGACINSKITKFILRLCFSHVGMFFIVILYTVLGGLAFRYIEGGDEEARYETVKQGHINVDRTRTNTRDKILLTVNNNMGGNATYTIQQIYALLNEYQSSISEALSNTSSFPGYQFGYRGENGTPEFQAKWGYASAFMFTASILTTIGYGHVYPISQSGYMICLIYSVFAIPLMSMFIMNVGSLLANGIRMVYHRGCCFFIERKRHRTHEGINNSNQNAVMDANESRPRSAWSDEEKPPHDEDVIKGLPEHERPAFIVSAENDQFDKEGNSHEIPAALAALVVILYLIAGTFVYSVWEQWTLMEAAYFCVVTLLTIGFGDLVPGSNELNTTNGQIRIAFATVYIIIGLPILGMGISLIIAAVTERFKAMGREIENRTGIDVVDENNATKAKKDEVEPFVKQPNVKESNVDEPIMQE